MTNRVGGLGEKFMALKMKRLYLKKRIHYERETSKVFLDCNISHFAQSEKNTAEHSFELSKV